MIEELLKLFKRNTKKDVTKAEIIPNIQKQYSTTTIVQIDDEEDFIELRLSEEVEKMSFQAVKECLNSQEFSLRGEFTLNLIWKCISYSYNFKNENNEIKKITSPLKSLLFIRRKEQFKDDDLELGLIGVFLLGDGPSKHYSLIVNDTKVDLWDDEGKKRIIVEKLLYTSNRKEMPMFLSWVSKNYEQVIKDFEKKMKSSIQRNNCLQFAAMLVSKLTDGAVHIPLQSQPSYFFRKFDFTSSDNYNEMNFVTWTSD